VTLRQFSELCCRYCSANSLEIGISHNTSCLATHEETEIWTVNLFLNTVDTFVGVSSVSVQLFGLIN